MLYKCIRCCSLVTHCTLVKFSFSHPLYVEVCCAADKEISLLLTQLDSRPRSSRLCVLTIRLTHAAQKSLAQSPSQAVGSSLPGGASVTYSSGTSGLQPSRPTTAEVGGPLIMVFRIASDSTTLDTGSWLSSFQVIAPREITTTK